MKIFYEKNGVVEAKVDLGSRVMIVSWLNLFDDKAVEECTIAQMDEVKKEFA